MTLVTVKVTHTKTTWHHIATVGFTISVLNPRLQSEKTCHIEKQTTFKQKRWRKSQFYEGHLKASGGCLRLKTGTPAPEAPVMWLTDTTANQKARNVFWSAEAYHEDCVCEQILDDVNFCFHSSPLPHVCLYDPRECLSMRKLLGC